MSLLLELKAMAIIGNIRNMSQDCIERPRPRVQYIHFWRGIKKKLRETLSEMKSFRQSTGSEIPLESDLIELSQILETWQKPTNSDSPEISKACLQWLGRKSYI